jgi:signal transduction histidine kinase
MTAAAVISIASAWVSLMTGVVAIAVSRGAVLRSLRWYAVASLMAAIFSAGNVLVGLPVSDAAVVLAARVTLSAGALHGAAWVAFDLESEGRTAGLAEKLSIAGALSCAALAHIPDLFVTNVVVPRTAWFGIVYRDAMPTKLGMLTYAYYCAAITALVVRNGARLARGEWRALPNFVGLTALTVAAVLDSLAASQVTRMPYMLDIATMVAVVSIGAGVGRRFVETALALEESSRQLAQAQAELVARERLAAVGEMSAVVAHEVRNPLAVMFNAIGGLRRELGDDTKGHSAELLGILQEEADRLRRLVDDFLDFARPLSLRMQRTEASQLLLSAVASAQAAAPSEHRVTVALEGDLGDIECDAQLVRHAVVNLVVNALQIDAPPMLIDVRARRAEAHLYIEVADRGPGVSDKSASKLFLPFFTTRARGTGLGLTIVKRVASAHGGAIEHAPTSGGGATFVLTMPVTPLGSRGSALDRAAE